MNDPIVVGVDLNVRTGEFVGQTEFFQCREGMPVILNSSLTATGMDNIVVRNSSDSRISASIRCVCAGSSC